MKIIGIPTRIVTVNGRRKEYINQTYLKIVQKYQLTPLLLATTTYDNPTVLKHCSGFLLPGGVDIDPAYFNEENTGLSKNIEPEIDEMDRRIVEYAKANQIPLLGICRGMQAINIFLGGTIYQDIGCEHKHIISDHKVETYPNRLLNFKRCIAVNSYHHQALKDLAPGLAVIARHNDGTVEGIIHRELPIFGVQWHPEMLPDSPETDIIFRCFRNLME